MPIIVEGGAPLNGVYTPAGNPNAAQALIAAALLTDAEITLHNVPRTLSTQTIYTLAEQLGAALTWDDDTVTVAQARMNRRTISESDVSTGALLFAAPMLIQRQQIRIEIDFPLNRIRTHLEAMRDLGIDIVTSAGAVELKAAPWDTKDIVLTQASVTATAIIVMLASRLGRETVIHNAACEPHVQQLCDLLVSMGARIDGIGSNLLRVFGVSELGGASITLRPDHIEAGSIAALAALSGGRVQIDGICRDDLRVISKIFWRLGITLDLDEFTAYVPKHETLTVSNREEDVDASIESAPWPGFPSDLVAVATVAATQARGTSLIHEKMFNNRLLFIDKLKAMGAQIVLCDPHRAIVVGRTHLSGVYMDTPDVRAGLGLLAAALIARGRSTIDNEQVLEHTFSGVLGKLQALGAQIQIT